MKYSFRLLWSDEALEDLEAIYNYYLPLNYRSATELYNRLLDEAARLPATPRLGRREPVLESEPEEYRSLVVKPGIYKIIYIIEVDIIYVTHIWDCRQDPARLNPYR